MGPADRRLDRETERFIASQTQSPLHYLEPGEATRRITPPPEHHHWTIPVDWESWDQDRKTKWVKDRLKEVIASTEGA